MKKLVAREESLVVRTAFRAKGDDAYSRGIQEPAGEGGKGEKQEHKPQVKHFRQSQMLWQNNGGEYMYRVLVIDEENDLVEINAQCNSIYLETTDEKDSLYSYVLGDTHSMTFNKEENNE